MEIAESKDGEVNVLAPKGSLNTQTSPKLEQKLNALLTAKARLVVIDFKGVDYLSSAALRVLLMITRRLVRAHGRLVLCAMSEDLKKVFAISGFDKDFTILASRGEAVELAASTPPPPPGAESETKAGKKGAKAAPKAPAPAAPETPPAAGGAPGWPFLAAPAKPKAEPAADAAEAEAPEPPAAAPPKAAPAPAPHKLAEETSEDLPGPNQARVARLLASGDGEAPWLGWAAAPAAQALAERVSRILSTGL